MVWTKKKVTAAKPITATKVQEMEEEDYIHNPIPDYPEEEPEPQVQRPRGRTLVYPPIQQPQSQIEPIWEVGKIGIQFAPVIKNKVTGQTLSAEEALVEILEKLETIYAIVEGLEKS